MNILHICLSCFYIDDHSYQENLLVRKHVEMGNNVKVLASTEIFNDKKELSYCAPTVYFGSDGAEVTRIPYRTIFPLRMARKLRAHPKVYDWLEKFKPDIIIFHGMCGWELLTVLKYVKRNPTVKLWVDSHEDFGNSARGFISKYLLHYCYYRPIARYASKHVDEILCVATSVITFLQEFYGIDAEKLKFFPLGGIIPDDSEYYRQRLSFRKDLGFNSNEILVTQTGKFTTRKLLKSSLYAFKKCSNPNLRFIIAGEIIDDRENILELIKSDNRILFIGWQSSDEIDALLCATDIYLQPGTQSATMQNSLCKRCAVILADISSHLPFVKGNGWILNANNSLDDVLSEIADKAHILPHMSDISLKIATELLDYDKMAKYLSRG